MRKAKGRETPPAGLGKEWNVPSSGIPEEEIVWRVARVMNSARATGSE
jgi:hypothetical protein